MNKLAALALTIISLISLAGCQQGIEVYPSHIYVQGYEGDIIDTLVFVTNRTDRVLTDVCLGYSDSPDWVDQRQTCPGGDLFPGETVAIEFEFEFSQPGSASWTIYVVGGDTEILDEMPIDVTVFTP